MSDEFEKTLMKYLKSDSNTTIEFRKCCGFTFVFESRIITIDGRLSSAEIRPAGIIYDENGEYYFAPLYDVKNLEEIIEKYVMEEEYFHFQQ